MVTINPERLLADLRALAAIGRYETGVDRIAFSPADVEARRWLQARMAEAGLEPAVDGLGNVYGRSPVPGPAVLVGSHTDSVPKGGWLDGALGVLYGLEIARAAIEQGSRQAIDVVSFQDEEGSYLPCLGSRAFCGLLDEAEIARARGADGRPLPEAIAASGFEGPPIRLDRERVRAFFEAHIEQGPRLEAAGVPVGVVSGIVHIRRFRVSASGRADHAGTTPMGMRRDAGAAVIRVAYAVLESFPRIATADSVWNIGVIGFEPNSANVVPQAANMVVEMRDLDADTVDRLEARLAEIVEDADANGPCELALRGIGRVDGVPMDPRLRELLAEGARRVGVAALTLPSGAGHDAMILAKAVPSALLFVPSIDGRSHDIAENTRDEDIVTGCRVLAAAIDALAAAGG